MVTIVTPSQLDSLFASQSSEKKEEQASEKSEKSENPSDATNVKEGFWEEISSPKPGCSKDTDGPSK